MNNDLEPAPTRDSETEAPHGAQPLVPRSEAIVRNWQSFNWGSAFSAFIYPALGVLVFALALTLALVFEGIHVHAWYVLPILATAVVATLLCNFGIGSLHRVWQHRGAEMAGPAQTFVALNCILAMQGPLKDWINYHAAHHRYADLPGDPHNPFESKLWAWVGWVLWRDPADIAKPMPNWIARNPVVCWADRNYMGLSTIVHLLVPLAAYLIVFLAGGSLVLVALLHATAVIARGIHFHSTTLGINVAGHLDVPKWVTWTLALATGGEAFHDHHHKFPRSILHLPRKGIVNRLFDYNGTFLLVLERLGMLRQSRIAPQFA